ncbi:aspartate-alanine antiporter [Pseudomonas sp. BIGb0408]|uniref:Aspartate-alanine antiporter n=1 Tax=Phytopseudomonas flavescens TaxID=29435 RepID=A0A7Y9XN61_9GAMM|nr:MULTISPECIES: aspartate-alanine antiporter [Pseudomonas]MCW2292339.1 aspartate-alanine antiporter [Pseudomonas sp. BIGb0408]NYH73089.1 aspartate-alanine antiporter [Pseudomonas flavescens]
MDFLHQVLNQSPELALFLSLAIGYWVGSIQFGKFQLGGVAGSLLAAVVISQLGVTIDNGIKSVLFALFIYAVGFESGPQFFRSLGRHSLREIVLAAVMALSGLATVVIAARLLDLDKGLAAGIAAGSMTQSAIIGTASAAIAKLDLPLEQIQALQGNVAVGYAVTYIFGSFGAIIMCVNILPWFMKRAIRDDATKAEAELLAGARVYGPGEQPAIAPLIGRIYRVEQAAGKTVEQLEALQQGSGQTTLTVERIKRGGALVGIAPDTVLENGDVVLVVGRRAGVVAIAEQLGAELQSYPDMDVVVVQRELTIDNPAFLNRTVADIRQEANRTLRHGVYVVEVKRGGRPLALQHDTVIASGDLVMLYGTPDDIQRVAKQVGSVIVPSDKTDFVFHGFGLVVGLLIGMIVVRLGAVPLTLGSGGGALIAGLAFGWYSSLHMTRGNMPTPASTLLRDLGLAGFVAVVGLQSGRQAVETIATQGVSIFLVGVVVCIVPILIAMLVGRYVLRYDNVALFAGALSGARSANPAFGEVLDKAGNSIPTVPFAVTYALANVFLTLLGPLVVAFA